MGCWWDASLTTPRPSCSRRSVPVPETEFARATRADAPPNGYAGDFIETPIGPDRVYYGHDAIASWR